MHVRFREPEIQRPLMTFLRGAGLIVFADDDTTVEVVVPHLYDERERLAVEELLGQFAESQPHPVEFAVES